MSYLIASDYLPLIQEDNLQAVIQQNAATQSKGEHAAQAEAISWLRQKYDTAQEFKDTLLWKKAGPGTIPGYKPITATAWVTLTKYIIGTQVDYDNGAGHHIWQCIVANADAVFTPANWLDLGPTGATLYQVTDRVYITAAAWLASATPWVTLTAYAVGAKVLQAGNVYQCITANTDAAFTVGNWQLLYAYTAYATDNLVLFTDGNIYECVTGNSDINFTVGKWKLLGAQYSIFFAAYPFPLFDISKGVYNVGDKVFWKGRIYTALQQTRIIDHETRLQFGKSQYEPLSNVFPDDPREGLNSWGPGMPYAVPVGIEITDTNYWTAGDNRDAQLVQKLIDITLYHLHCNIAPRNVPQHRVTRYKGDEKDFVASVGGKATFPVYSAIGWLQACSRGEITPNLPLLQPPQGSRIRFGGNERNINSY